MKYLKSKSLDELLEMYEKALEITVDKRIENAEAHRAAGSVGSFIISKLEEIREKEGVGLKYLNYKKRYLELLKKDVVWADEQELRTEVAYA